MKNVPELRFDGYEEEWEEKKYNNIFSKFQYGLNAPSKDFDGINKYLRITDIDDETRKFKSENITSPDDDLDKLSPYTLEDGDICFARTGATVGKTYKYNPTDGKVYFAGYLIKGSIESDFDSDFIFQSTLTKKYENFIKITSQRSGQPGVNSSELSNYKISSPDKNEQEKIGDLFRKIDALIEKQEGKVSKLEDFKKSMLQKMFPKKGELVPEFRFEGFDGEWEEISIGDKFEVTMGQSPNSENYTTDINAMILVQGNADLENGHVTPRIFTKEVTKTSKKGDILMTVRAPVGTLAVNEYDVVIGRGVCSIKGNTFLYYSLTNMNLNNYWNRFSSGSTFESINSLDIKNASLKIPSLAEQQKIGNFFKNLDRQIETEEKLLESYKQMKKSLLQKMFV